MGGIGSRGGSGRWRALVALVAHAWEIAALDDGKKYAWKTNSKSGEGTLGKAVMLKADWWYGEKSLIPGTKSYELGQSYYKAKGVK